MKRSDLRAGYAHPNVFALCAVIDLGEHGANADSPDRYRTLYGGELFEAPPWTHPRKKVNAGGITSTAAGRGQFLAGTWDDVAGLYDLPDFSPECQDEAMVALIIRRGALADILAGKFESAIARCAHEWASLPGSPYGQPTLTMEAAKARYEACGGQYEAQAEQPAAQPETLVTQQEDKPMIPVPLILAGLDFLKSAFPTVQNALKNPSVPERNVEIGGALLDAATKATGSANFQEAIEKIQTDPAAKKAAEDALHLALPGLIEIGGGIVEARKANQAAAEVPLLRDRALIIGLVFMVGVFMLLVDVFYVHPAQYDGNLRTQIVTGVLGLAAMVGAYFLGSSLGSQRKTDIIATSPAKE